MKLANKLAIGFLCLLLSGVLAAQVQTESSTSQGKATVKTTVERGEVVNVSGNDLIVKMEDGTIRNFPDVPESARITVGGQQLSIHDLKPGMKLERTITTTTTPQVVTTVHTVKGTVWQVRPPIWVTLRLEDGSVEQFKIPEGQKFMVNVPENVISQQRSVTGQMPPPPTEAVQGPVLIVVQKQVAPPQVAQANPPAAQPKAQKLPQTASDLPLIGLIGTVLVLFGVAVFLMGSRRTIA
jgi:hypothetical protein